MSLEYDQAANGTEGPSAQKRTVRNENTDNIPAISGENGQVHSAIAMNWLFAACSHGVQPTLHAMFQSGLVYCTQQTGGLTRGLALRAIHADHQSHLPVGIGIYASLLVAQPYP